MHLKNVQKPRGFCTCWRVLVHGLSGGFASSTLVWQFLHLVHSTPPSVVAGALQMYNNDIHHAFAAAKTQPTSAKRKLGLLPSIAQGSALRVTAGSDVLWQSVARTIPTIQSAQNMAGNAYH